MERLVYFYNQGHEQHHEPGHPERPERVEAIVSALSEHNLWTEYPKLNALEISEPVMTKIHTQAFLNTLEETCRAGRHFDADTYTRPASWKLAHRAAGGAAAVAQTVWLREAERGFALTRPPGHHATAERAMGFCLLNNISLAAEHLIQEQGAEKLAIIDLDLHHGNGTQDIFYKRRDVLYISTHQYPHYPGTGWINETGSEEGKMTNANLPLPPFSGDRAFLRSMDEFILPILDRYLPDMLLVSYGFDPHFEDPLGNLQLTSSGYGNLLQQLVKFADSNCMGRIALFLEGGYDLQAARACSLAVTAALLGEKLPERYDQTMREGKDAESEAYLSILQQAKQIWELA